MQLFNFDCIKYLNNLIESDEDRQDIIGLCVYIGSYKARKKLHPSGYFTRFRDTTSRIAEARYIALQHQKTIDLLADVKQPEKVKKGLEKFLEEISKNDVANSHLSGHIDSLKEGRISLSDIGRKVEKKFLRTDKRIYSKYRNKPNDREFNRIFLMEEETIRHAIIYESNERL